MQQRILTAEDIAAGVERLALAIRGKTQGQPLALIGIRSRGDEVAQRLLNILSEEDRDLSFGVLDISLYRADGVLRVEVADDGVGFASRRTPSRGSMAHGFGIFSIRERLEHLGGSLTIDSEAGQGTRARLCIPLRPRQRTRRRKFFWAVSMAASAGRAPRGLLAADFDLRPFLPSEMDNEAASGYYFRDQKSVVTRIPEAFGGQGLYIQGDQRQTIPLLYKYIIEAR
jgi:hypothetical protein